MRIALFASTALFASIATTAWAQNAAAPATAAAQITGSDTNRGSSQNATRGNGDVDTVIVTVRRREERLIDVPMSASVVTGGDILNRGIQSNTQALLTGVAGLNFRPSSSASIGKFPFVDLAPMGLGPAIAGSGCTGTVCTLPAGSSLDEILPEPTSSTSSG
jgi:outer membrane receptor protein involved in Fe transport